MSRIGYQVEKENAGEIAQISKLPHIIIWRVSLPTLQGADEKDKTGAHKQLDLFQKNDCNVQRRRCYLPSCTLFKQRRNYRFAGSKYGHCKSGNYIIRTLAIG